MRCAVVELCIILPMSRVQSGWGAARAQSAADGSVEFAVVAVAIPSLPAGGPSAFAADLGVEGYPLYLLGGMAMLDDAGAPGAAQAWSWMKANVETPAAASLTTAPKWAIVPRTDSNTLPAIPTATAQG